jgi:diguanylate cyclase (GGDEF)-like protein/PAS domain S-box-containing protein
VAKHQGILRLLLVDDSLTDADNVINILRSAGHSVRAARHTSLVELESALTQSAWDFVVCRDGLAELPPRELLAFISRLGRDLPCIVLANEQDDLESLFGIGAQDVILVSDAQRLQFAVERELDNLFSRRSSRRIERALRESEKRSRLLLESSKDAVAYMHEGMHIYVNQAYLRLFGYDEAEDIDGLPFLDMITTEDHMTFKSSYRKFSEQTDAKPQTVEVNCVTAEGAVFLSTIEFSHAQVEGEACTQVVVRDAIESSPLVEQDELFRQQDFLTGLYNREYFIDELTKATGHAGDGKGDSALLYLVIDDFSVIKSQVGLAASEDVVKNIAQYLKNALTDTDILARYSDQVFTVIVSSNDDEYVDGRAEIYRKVIEQHSYQVNGKMVQVHCSIGISRISETQSSNDVVLDLADSACHAAQKAGGNQFVRNQPALSLNETLKLDDESVEWQARIKQAVSDDTLVLFYQPIVTLHGKEQELYEVLIRLTGSEGEIIPTDQFMKHIIKTELMGDVDYWIIKHAVMKLVEHREKYPNTRFFIKLSQQILDSEQFIDWLIELINQQKIDGNAFVFQVSETAAFNNLERTALVISRLKSIGCEFGLEHFGSGLDFSQSLAELDVDYLKINGAFVENMSKDSENQAAVKAIIEMTKEAGKFSIAEFVSDANSLALLWRLGVNYAQGFYIHEPSESLDYNFQDDDL